MKKVLVVVGPTASGKSDLAIRLARLAHGKRFKKLGINGAEIISADSRQVYRGLDIGSGKITKREMRGIPHHLLSVANPQKQFTASDYKKLTEETITMIYHSGKLPIIVGGTGFYIDTLTRGVEFPSVPPNAKLRKKLLAKSAEELFKLLEKKDPRRAGEIDKHNKVRLIRALEIVEALGQVPPTPPPSPSPWQGEGLGRGEFIFIGLKPDNIDKKIRLRLEKRLTAIIREARKLHHPPTGRGLSYKRMYELGLEYRYASLYLQKKITKTEMTEQLYTSIRQYAKRQMTYWKRNPNIKWFTLSKVEGFTPNEYKKIEKYIQNMLG